MQTLLAEGFVVEDGCGFTFLPNAVTSEVAIVCLVSTVALELESPPAVNPAT